MENKKEKKIELFKILPFILTAVVIILDQVTKCLVVKYIPQSTSYPLNAYYSWFDGFLQIVHVRNTGAAFSMGYAWPSVVRQIMLILIPIVVIAIIVRICLKSDDLTILQRWCVCGIIGGGVGNIIDRIFRFETGVVDFIDMPWFGLHQFDNTPVLKFLSMDRWPTFNVGDAFVVVCGVTLIISFIIVYAKQSKQEKAKKAKEETK